MTHVKNNTRKNNVANSANDSALHYWHIIDKATQIVITSVCCDTREDAERHLKNLVKDGKLPSKVSAYMLKQSKTTDGNGKLIQPKVETETDKAARKAAKAAEREAAREARKAAKEADRKDCKSFDETTMSINDALRAVAAHADEKLPSGVTIAEFMEKRGLKKLTVKALKECLHPFFIGADGIYMPTCIPAVFDGAPEDERNGAKIYIFDSKKKSYLTCQLHSRKRVELWSPRVVRQLLEKSLSYGEKAERYAKRNALVKNSKEFFVLEERTEKAVNGKSNSLKTVKETYVKVDAANVKFAE